MNRRQWSNEQMFEELFGDIIRHIYKVAGDREYREELADAGDERCPESLFEEFVSLMEWPVLRFLAYVDGEAGPSDWPGLDLVNGLTKERLADDFRTVYASFEQEYRRTHLPDFSDLRDSEERNDPAGS